MDIRLLCPTGKVGQLVTKVVSEQDKAAQGHSSREFRKMEAVHAMLTGHRGNNHTQATGS